jgi:hypothetical protein
MGRQCLILTCGCYRCFAVAHGAAIHAAIDYLRNHNRANVLVQRTSPARFFVKCPGGSDVTLAMQVRLCPEYLLARCVYCTISEFAGG